VDGVIDLLHTGKLDDGLAGHDKLSGHVDPTSKNPTYRASTYRV